MSPPAPPPTRSLKKEIGGSNIAVFNSNDDAVLALKTGQVDAVATDLPTAFYLADSQVDNGVVSGQFADTSGGDQFGIVLPKDSPNTAKVTAAVDALTLERRARRHHQEVAVDDGERPGLQVTVRARTEAPRVGS